MKNKLAVAIALSTLPSLTMAAETSINGFGSLIGTSILDGEGYWVTHPSGAGLYQGDVGLELIEESLVGLQGVVSFTPDISMTAQIISRGQNAWSPELEQFYINYDVTSEWSLKAGKLRNPVYLYSDAMDIHYSFGWLRTPSTTYSITGDSFNGVSAMYSGSLGNISNRTIFYYGQMDKDPDPFLTELFVNRKFDTAFTTGETDNNGAFLPLTEYRYKVEDVFGVSTEFFIGDFTAHFAFMESGGEKGINTYSNGSTFTEEFPWRDFYDVAFIYDDSNWLAIAEWNDYVGVYSSYYATIGKYVNDWQFLLTYGRFNGDVKLANGFELPKEQNQFTKTHTLTARHELTAGIALKMELIKFKNDHSLIVIDENQDGKIDSTILSFAIDFVF